MLFKSQSTLLFQHGVIYARILTCYRAEIHPGDSEPIYLAWEKCGLYSLENRCWAGGGAGGIG